MDYAKAILGKSSHELTYADLESFFRYEKEESDQIEFKAYTGTGSIESKLPGVIRSIAAFLNSDGGLLIWGAPVGEKQFIGERKVTVFKGPLTDLPAEISDKDWIINKIVDKIIPLPVGIRVQLIKRDNHTAALFEIDKSLYAPHQTDERYFMRLDGQTRTAPHHYVEALFNRISYPQLETYIKIDRIFYNSDYIVQGLFYFTNKSIQNEEMFSAEIQIHGGTIGAGEPYKVYNHEGCLYFGQWVQSRFSIRFSTEQLHHFENIGRIVVLFGGKTAPRKICEYAIDFNHNDLTADNYKRIVSIIEENRLQSDIIAEKNISEEEKLNFMKVIRNFKK